MQTRRAFLRNLLVTLAAFPAIDQVVTARELNSFKGDEVFYRILSKAAEGNWHVLPIGELMGRIALELQNTPYRDSTLELSLDREICSADLTGLDCVTFFETTLDFARMIKLGGTTPDDLLAQINLTRYRGGKLGDYTSRLHYTTDWFVDNENKHTVKILSQLPAVEDFTQKVKIMSSHPDSYRQLVAHPELVSKIKHQESAINKRSLKFIPLDAIAEIEPHLQTGDIVGVCTSIPGVDITHTGLVYCDEKGVRHFMDASSKKSKMKVTIEPGPISQALTWSKNNTGAMFARPLEPVSRIRKA